MRRIAGAIAALLVAATLVLPASAVAAPTPSAGGSLDLQAWADSGQLIVVTAVALDPTVKLPATVRIPLVSGATVTWAGEVLGGDISADPARQYKIKNGAGGGRYVEFTVETTHAAQVDATVSGIAVNGATTMAKFEWVQSVDSPFTSFSVRVPAGSTGVTISPTPTYEPETSATGEKLYYGDPIPLKPGAKKQVSFAYTTGAVSAPAGGGGSSATPLIFGLVVAIMAAIGVLVVLIVRQRGASQG